MQYGPDPLRRGLISNGCMASKRQHGLACDDILQCKDYNGGGLMVGCGSGWPASPSDVDDLLPFLVFATLSPMFGLLVPADTCCMQ